MALLPHMALSDQTVANPDSVLDPHIADDPHMAEFDPTNCDAPQTDVLPHIAEEPQVEPGANTRNASLDLASKRAVGDIAEPVLTT